MKQQSLTDKFKEVIFLFELYHKIGQDDTMKIFRRFPYLMCLPPRRIQLFLSEFRKYRFTGQEIVHVCTNSGGLLGISHRSLVGLFDTLRNNYKMDAKTVKACIIACPELALQNRQDLIRRKAELIMKESGRH